MSDGTFALKPTPVAKRKVLVLLAASLVVSVACDVFGWRSSGFEPSAEGNANFALVAAFLIVAQVIERLLEGIEAFFSFGDHPDPAQRQTDRALIMFGVATLVGVVASAVMGLYLFEAVGAGPQVPWWLDLLLTGVTLSGGTKGLHDLIKTVEKARAPA